MKEYYDVIEFTIELLETIDEGLTQSRKLLLKQKYEDALYMLQDSIEGILSVDRAIQPVLNEIKKDHLIKPHYSRLSASINTLVDDYENNRGSNTLKILISDLEPSYNEWRKELTKVLSPLHSILTKMVNKYGRGSTHLF